MSTHAARSNSSNVVRLPVPPPRRAEDLGDWQRLDVVLRKLLLKLEPRR